MFILKTSFGISVDHYVKSKHHLNTRMKMMRKIIIISSSSSISILRPHYVLSTCT